MLSLGSPVSGLKWLNGNKKEWLIGSVGSRLFFGARNEGLMR